ncbi:MAG: hypothetical protein ABL907_08540 [Hyphomicrobium sp.]
MTSKTLNTGAANASGKTIGLQIDGADPKIVEKPRAGLDHYRARNAAIKAASRERQQSSEHATRYEQQADQRDADLASAAAKDMARVAADEVQTQLGAVFKHVSGGGQFMMLHLPWHDTHPATQARLDAEAKEKATPEDVARGRDKAAGTYGNKPFMLLDEMIAAAAKQAHRTAKARDDEPLVAVSFSPAVYGAKQTEAGKISAAIENLLGVTGLLVEVDDAPQEARLKLVTVLGEPTTVWETGGKTTNNEAKLAMFWRYSHVATSKDDLALALDLKRRAAEFSGADESGNLNQPCRIAGVPHQKEGKARSRSRLEVRPAIWGDAPEYTLEGLARKMKAAHPELKAGAKGQWKSEDAKADKQDLLLEEIEQGLDGCRARINALCMSWAAAGLSGRYIARMIERAIDAAEKSGAMETARARKHRDNIGTAIKSALERGSESAENAEAWREKIAEMRDNSEGLKSAVRNAVAKLTPANIAEGCGDLDSGDGLFSDIGRSRFSDADRSLLADQIGKALRHKKTSDIRKLIEKWSGIWGKRLKDANNPHEATPLGEVPDRPLIHGDGGLELTELIYARLREVNTTSPTPRIYSTFDKLARVVKDENGAWMIDALKLQGLRSELDRMAQFMSMLGPQHAPSDTCGIILEDRQRPDDVCPGLNAVIDSPRYGPGWQIMDKPGYYADTKTLLVHNAALEGLDVPKAPTQDEVKVARELLLNDLFADFPFNDVDDGGKVFEGTPEQIRLQRGQASRANLIGMMLTALVMYADDKMPIPQFVFSKAQQRVGASLCAEAAQIVLFGDAVEPSAQPTDDYQWQNTMLGWVREKPNAVFLDNVKKKIDNGMLAASHTSRRLKGRGLGLNANISGPVTWLTIITGINPAMSGELVDRSASVRFAAEDANPKGRTGFRYPDIKKHARENRAAYLRALLVLVNNWLAQDRPVASGLTAFGGFEDWNATVGGILSAAGIDGFRQNENNFADINEEADVESAMYDAWWHAWGAQEVRVGDAELSGAILTEDAGLLGMIKRDELAARIVGDDGKALDTATMSRDMQLSRLGLWLRPRLNAVRRVQADGFTYDVAIEKGLNLKRQAVYKLAVKNKVKAE